MNLPPRATFVAADAVAITLSLVIAHLLRFGVSVGAAARARTSRTCWWRCFAVPVWLAVLALAGCYDRRILGVGSDEYRRVLNGGVHFLAVVAVAHFVGRLVIARGYVGVLIPVAVVLTLLTRFTLRLWLYRQRAPRPLRPPAAAGRARRVRSSRSASTWSAPSGRATSSSGCASTTDRTELSIGSLSVPVVGPPADVRGRARRLPGRRGGGHDRVRSPASSRRCSPTWRAARCRCWWRPPSPTSPGRARSCATSPACPCSTSRNRPSPALSVWRRRCSTGSPRPLALIVLAPVFLRARAGGRASTRPGPCSSGRRGWAATAAGSRW